MAIKENGYFLEQVVEGRMKYTGDEGILLS